MKIDIEATPEQIRKVIALAGNDESLTSIVQQLSNCLLTSDDSQVDEVPQEGDNEIIKRDE
ncbi:hypothetical protein DYU05_00315 [Mucilaginibacter terrenus]|uniref:Uncharacterized protein n=1 Tax=Mucilaginibacter terrenus TaxID=2482727 RepID=A0A3E2NT39_9SPHI|nr:hypothetical protein [Mucilaginibacter terrenus]RFZ84117.1 hypothetical protein DYU05_00315 [Mucilaginibacter terrenus]